jgi:hypothetical protein
MKLWLWRPGYTPVPENVTGRVKGESLKDMLSPLFASSAYLRSR